MTNIAAAAAVRAARRYFTIIRSFPNAVARIVARTISPTWTTQANLKGYSATCNPARALPHPRVPSNVGE